MSKNQNRIDAEDARKSSAECMHDTYVYHVTVMARLNSLLPALKQANQTLVPAAKQQDKANLLEIHDEDEEETLDPQLCGDEDEQYIDMVCLGTACHDTELVCRSTRGEEGRGGNDVVMSVCNEQRKRPMVEELASADNDSEDDSESESDDDEMQQE